MNIRDLWRATGVRFVNDVGNVWRWWSMRFNAVGLLILGWVQIDPVSALSVWNMMPAAARDVLPKHFISYAGLILFALGMLSRIVKQPKLDG
jgi:hypothetical protein